MKFENIENLYARRGTASPNLCFAGHTDVVPTGSEQAWSSGPFEAEVKDGVLYGRGAVDMKGGIAAWVAAVSRVLAEGEFPGSLSFLITGDEEGPALHGTKRVVETLMAEGEVIDACVVGEPSSSQVLGDMIKVGRRGSLNTWITVHGKQGHVAYPDRAANPAPVLARLLTRLDDHVLDDGYPEFPPSNLEITTIDIGNPATNIIPAGAKARLNIRFNPTHTGDDLIAWLNAMAGEAAGGVRPAHRAGASVLGQRLPDRARSLRRRGAGRGAGRDRTTARSLDHRRHLGRPLHPGHVSGAGAGPRRPDHAPDRRTRARGRDRGAGRGLSPRDRDLFPAGLRMAFGAGS